MGDTLVRDYLHRLDVAAASLPPDRRSELRQEIADHIAQARAAGDVGNEAALRQLLDRIGDPEDIVAAAREEETSSPGHSYPPTDYHPRGIGLEITAVMLLTVGSIVPLFGWLAGVVLLWVSQRWRVGEKVLATLVVPGGPFTFLLILGLAPGESCVQSTSGNLTTGEVFVGPESCTGFSLPLWLGIPILVVGPVGPFIIGGVLLRRARVRADSEAAGS